MKNDWILANMSNPDMDTLDLSVLGGLNTENTLMLPEEVYLNSKLIQQSEQFQDENNKFSKARFSDFYLSLIPRWLELQEDEASSDLKIDMFDTDAIKPGARIKDPNIRFSAYNQKVVDTGNARLQFSPYYRNPDRQKEGIEGWNILSDRTKSESELAQSSFIYDPEMDKYLNDTPETYALFESPTKYLTNIIFGEPLVLATYDKETVDSEGIVHKPGEYKLNKEGTYYYEKLNGRSPIGKLVLSATDILTPENSALNHIDFMDSDDLYKSVPGVIAKNVALLAPIFTPAAPYYYTAIIAKELTRTLPMLYNFSEILGNTTPAPEWLNTVAAKGESFTTGTSVWSKQNTFTFENIANMISDVALLWGQLKQIAKSLSFFDEKNQIAIAEKRAKAYYDKKIASTMASQAVPEGVDWKKTVLGAASLKKFLDPVYKTAAQRLKWGQDLALVYMALISNTDVYASMKEQGATDLEAASVSLGSTIGMFGVDKFLHLGEIFYDDLASLTFREGRREIAKEAEDVIATIYKTEASEAPTNLIQKGVALGKLMASKYYEKLKDRSLGGWGKALGEGLEEVSEELVTDMSKGIYMLLGDLGLYDRSVKNPIDYEHALERYTMSFLGGSIGGGMFYLKDRYSGFHGTKEDKNLLDLIRDNKADELRQIVKKRIKEGKFGSTTLSGKDYVLGEDNKVTWLSTKNKESSQNDIIGNLILDKINQLEAVIMDNNVNLSDDLLFDNMVMQELRYQNYKNASKVTGYYQEFNKHLANLAAAEDTYKRASASPDGNPKNKDKGPIDSEKLTPAEEATKNERLAKFKGSLDEARKKMLDFLSGDTSLDYTRKLDFALDPVLNSIFLDLNYVDWLSKRVDVSKLKELNPDDLLKLLEDWDKEVEEKMRTLLDLGFESFKKLDDLLAPLLLNHQLTISPEYKKAKLALDKIYDVYKNKESEELEFAAFAKNHKFVSWNDRIPNENGEEESDEDYEDRNKIGDDAPIDIKEKNLRRAVRMNTLNNAILQQFVDLYESILQPINYQVDSSTARQLQVLTNYKYQSILKDLSTFPIWVNNSLFNSTPYLDHIRKLKEDFSNLDEVKQAIYDQQSRTRDSLYQDLRLIMSDYGEIAIPLDMGALLSIDLDQLDTLSNEELVRTNIVEEDYVEDEDFRKDGIEVRKNKIRQLIEQYKNLPESDPLKATLLEELRKLIPANMSHQYDYISNIMDKIIWDLELDEVPLEEIQRDLLDPDSELVETLYKYNPNMYEIFKTLINVASINFGTDTWAGILGNDSDNVDRYTWDFILNQKEATDSYMDLLINTIKTNPVYAFIQKLDVSLNSPLKDIFNAISKEISDNPREIFNINSILNTAYKGYMKAEGLYDFQLSPTESVLMDNVIKVLELAQAYIYTATASENHHLDSANESFNERLNTFAKKHLDQLTKPWEALPILDRDYATVLRDEADRLGMEALLWKQLSESNRMNKLGRLSKAEDKTNLARFKAIKKHIEHTHFTVGDKEYFLGEGIDALPTLTESSNNKLKTLFDVERTIYNNFLKILEKSKMTPEEFFKKTDFWKQMFSDPNDMYLQKSSDINESLEDITLYDEALYWLSLLSDDPVSYYRSVRAGILENPTIAPLTVLLNLSRLGEAATSNVYKAGFKSLFDFVHPNTTLLNNLVYINGIGGAGKTDVVLRNIRQRFRDDKALIIGPTVSQASKLLNILGEDKYYTFDPLDDKNTNIFKALLSNYKDFNLAVIKFNNEFEAEKEKFLDSIDNEAVGKSLVLDNDFFTATFTLGPINNDLKFELKKDKFKFNDKFDLKLIFIDEAAHLSNLELKVLDTFAESVGGTIFAASDSTQSGYKKYQVGNLGVDQVFTSHTSRLTESLRSSNVLKQENNATMQSIVDSMDEYRNYRTEAEYREFMNKIPAKLKSFKARYYLDDNELNGDLISSDTEKFLPILLKATKEKASIGFIGDESSPMYQYLTNMGVEFTSKPLTDQFVPGKPFMLGLEFDYVVIDKLGGLENSDKWGAANWYAFIKRFNTLITRSKKGTIFTDEQLKHILGENVLDKLKSKGFSIADLVKIFREKYLKELDTLDLDSEVEEKTKEPKTEEPKTEELKAEEPVEEPKVEEPKTEETQEETPPVEEVVDALALAEALAATETVEALQEESKELTEKIAKTEEQETSSPEEEYLKEADLKDLTEKKENIDKLILNLTEGKVAEETPVKDENGTLIEKVEESPISESEPESKKVEEEPVGEVIVDTSNIENVPPEYSSNLTEEQIKEELNKAVKETLELFNEDPKKEPPTLIMSTLPTLNGLTVEANTVVPILGVREVDVPKSKYKAWEIKPTGKVRRNLNAFYTGSESLITDFKTKLQLQSHLSNIQSAILFGDADFHDSAISKLAGYDQAWKNREMFIQIRPVTEYDTMGIGTDLKPDYITINGKKYIAAVVCRLPKVRYASELEEFDAEFDICLLNDPNFLALPTTLNKIINNLKGLLANGKIDPKNVGDVESLIANISTISKEYSLFFLDVVTQFPDGVNLNLESHSYKSHGTTRLKSRTFVTDDGKEIVTSKRLGGLIDVKHNNEINHNSFKDMDSRKKVSDVYILSSKSDKLKGVLDKSIFGKAVVFVSSNTNIPESEMITRYIDQKLSPHNHTPEVRMIVLNNHGLSFSELVTHKILNLLTKNKDNSKKPWRMDVLGIRMFTALWNFRAGLKQINEAISNWLTQYNYDDALVERIAKTESHLYIKLHNKPLTLESFDLLYNENKALFDLTCAQNKVTIDQVKSLIKFNLEDCKNIPMFRLGFDITKTLAGGYVRPFKVTSNYYTKPEVNLLTLDLLTLKKYETLTSIILGQLTANEDDGALPYKPMNTKLMKKVVDANGDINLVDFKADEFIGRDDQHRNLSGMIHTVDKQIKIGLSNSLGEVQEELTVSPDAIFSFFPKALSLIASASKAYQTKGADDTIDISTISNVITTDANNTRSIKNEEDYFLFELKALFGENLLHSRGDDNTLLNMFSFMFHGSVENLEEAHAYAEDAPFKYGILVDPDLEYVDKDLYKTINILGINQTHSFVLLKCNTNLAFFDVNVDVIPGGMSISLTDLIAAFKEALLIKSGKKDPKVKTEPETPGPEIEVEADPVLVLTPMSSPYLNNLNLEEVDEYSNFLATNEDLDNGDNTLDNFNKYLEWKHLLILSELFNSQAITDEALTLVNMRLATAALPIEIQSLSIKNDLIAYIDVNGNTGILILNADDGSIQYKMDKIQDKPTLDDLLDTPEDTFDKEIIISGMSDQQNTYKSIRTKLLTYANQIPEGAFIQAISNSKTPEEMNNFLKEHSNEVLMFLRKIANINKTDSKLLGMYLMDIKNKC